MGYWGYILSVEATQLSVPTELNYCSLFTRKVVSVVLGETGLYSGQWNHAYPEPRWPRAQSSYRQYEYSVFIDRGSSIKLKDAFCENLCETCCSRLWYHKGRRVKGFIGFSLFHSHSKGNVCVYINRWVHTLKIVCSWIMTVICFTKNYI